MRLMPLRSMDHERLSREHGCSYQNEPAQWQKTSDQTGSGRHEDVLRNKNEPYDISSMGFPLQRNLGEELGLGLLGVERVPLPSQLSTRFLGVQILPLPPAFCDLGISSAATHYYHSA